MEDDLRKDSGFDALVDDLSSALGAAFETDASGLDFDARALAVFRHQYEWNPPYRALCDRRGVSPEGLERWEDAPLVPATAFKHLDLVSAPGAPEAVFRTSGTTEGGTTRGRHHVPRLSLYRASLVGPFTRHVVGENGPTHFVSLVPPAEDLPDSSLSYMVTSAGEALAERVDWVVGADGALDLPTLRDVSGEAARAGRPIALLGTALAFVHLLERLGAERIGPLAPGSRVMETGGFKGKGRAVSREALHGEIAAATGVDRDTIVNEYGMTELLSQLYEPLLSEGAGAAGTHVPPPWLRVRALDPTSLAELPEGEPGLLAFFDLANAGSVSHVLTEDVGSVRDGRVRLRGRASGAEPRGCSRAMDELMSAARVMR